MKPLIRRAAKWVIEYLELPNYIMVRGKGLLKGEKRYTDESVFWKDVLGPTFCSRPRKNAKTKKNEVIVLEGFQLSEWFPRIPGLYWTKLGKGIRNASFLEINYNEKLGHHFEPHITPIPEHFLRNP